MERAELLKMVDWEIEDATERINAAVRYREWRAYCREIEKALKLAPDHAAVLEIEKKHFDSIYRIVKLQGEMAEHWDKPVSEHDRILDVVRAVRGGEIPYVELLQALGVKDCPGPGTHGKLKCALEVGHSGPHRSEPKMGEDESISYQVDFHNSSETPVVDISYQTEMPPKDKP